MLQIVKKKPNLNYVQNSSMVSSSSAAKKHIYDLFIFSLKPRIDSQSLGENYFANKYKSKSKRRWAKNLKIKQTSGDFKSI